MAIQLELEQIKSLLRESMLGATPREKRYINAINSLVDAMAIRDTRADLNERKIDIAMEQSGLAIEMIKTHEDAELANALECESVTVSLLALRARLTQKYKRAGMYAELWDDHKALRKCSGKLSVRNVRSLYCSLKRDMLTRCGLPSDMTKGEYEAKNITPMHNAIDEIELELTKQLAQRIEEKQQAAQ